MDRKQSAAVKNDLNRRGVHAPLSKGEAQVKELRDQISALQKSLDSEKAARYRQESEKKRKNEEEKQNTLFSSQSRKLNEMRVKYNEDLKKQSQELERQIFDQISHSNGPFYEKMEKEFMAKLQSEINQRKGLLYEKAMIATKNMVKSQCEQKSGDIYLTVRETVEEDVKAEVCSRSGAFYDQLEETIRAFIYKEIQDEREAEKRLLETETIRFHQKYEEVVKDARKEVLEASMELRKDAESFIEKHEDKMKKDQIAEMKDLNEDWMKKWTEREEQWAKEKLEKKALYDQMQVEWSEKISAQAEHAMKRIDEGLELQGKKLNLHFDDLSTRMHKMEEVYESELQKRMSTQKECIEKMNQDYQESCQIVREQESKHIKTQIDYFAGMLKREQDEYEKSIESIQKNHEKERQHFQHIIAADKTRSNKERQMLEEDLRDQFNMLSNSHHEEMQRLSHERLKNSVSSLTSHAAEEERRIKMVLDATIKAEEAAREKFEKSVVEYKKQWEEKQKLIQEKIITKIKNQHLHIIRELKEKIEANNQIQETADKSWAKLQSEEQDKQLKHMVMFEKKCRQSFETKMKEYIKKYEGVIQEYHNKLVDVSTEAATEKINCVMQNESQRRLAKQRQYEQVERIRMQSNEKLKEMESRHSKELNHLSESLLNASEEMSIHQGTYKIQQQNEAHRQMKDIIGTTALERHRGIILRTWDDLGHLNLNRVPFFEKMFQSITFNQELLDLFQVESQKLMDMQPLNKLARRRESMRCQALCAKRLCDEQKKKREQETFGIHSPVPLSNQINTVDLDVLLAELKLLNDTLISQLQVFKSKYKEPFPFDGHPDYLSLIQSQALSLADTEHNLGAVLSSPVATDDLKALRADALQEQDQIKNIL